MNLVTALRFYSMFGSLESLLNLEPKHEMVTAKSFQEFFRLNKNILESGVKQSRRT